MEQPRKDLQISVTALSGDPDFVVSLVSDRPTCTEDPYIVCKNFTWRASSRGSDTMNISHVAPCSNANPFTEEHCENTDYKRGPVVSYYG